MWNTTGHVLFHVFELLRWLIQWHERARRSIVQMIRVCRALVVHPDKGQLGLPHLLHREALLRCEGHCAHLRKRAGRSGGAQGEALEVQQSERSNLAHYLQRSLDIYRRILREVFCKVRRVGNARKV